MSSSVSTTVKQVQVKLVLLGEAGVGKSSLVLRYVRNDFHTAQEPTIGAAFLTQKCRVPEEPTRIIKFEIWDTAGQERFYSIAPMYYRGANAAVVVYDVTKRSSLERARSWVSELQNQASPDIVIALAGNKSDLIVNLADGGAVLAEVEEINAEARVYAAQVGALFYETSAKTGMNVSELFVDIARHLPVELLNAREQPVYNTPPDSPKRGRSSYSSPSTGALNAKRFPLRILRRADETDDRPPAAGSLSACSC